MIFVNIIYIFFIFKFVFVYACFVLDVPFAFLFVVFWYDLLFVAFTRTCYFRFILFKNIT